MYAYVYIPGLDLPQRMGNELKWVLDLVESNVITQLCSPSRTNEDWTAVLNYVCMYIFCTYFTHAHRDAYVYTYYSKIPSHDQTRVL